ncbi:hypothetical protein JCM10450v2_008069 [Rhodotorula kratochvilovae]
MQSQSPSAWLAPSPAPALALSPSALPPASPAASLRPHPAPGPARRALSSRPPLGPLGATTQAGGSTAVLHSADPVNEARRALGVLLGAGDGEGLLDRVQRDVESLFASYEHAFDPAQPNSTATDPAHALDSLNALIALLSRSSAGGFVPSPAAAGGDPEGARLTQKHLDAAGERAQALFREGVKVREGAEVVRAGLSG